MTETFAETVLWLAEWDSVKCRAKCYQLECPLTRSTGNTLLGPKEDWNSHPLCTWQKQLLESSFFFPFLEIKLCSHNAKSKKTVAEVFYIQKAGQREAESLGIIGREKGCIAGKKDD